MPESDRPAYRKWARFYLDCCVRYGHSPRSPDSLAPFLAKLERKYRNAAREMHWYWFFPAATLTKVGPTGE